MLSPPPSPPRDSYHQHHHHHYHLHYVIVSWTKSTTTTITTTTTTTSMSISCGIARLRGSVRGLYLRVTRHTLQAHLYTCGVLFPHTSNPLTINRMTNLNTPLQTHLIHWHVSVTTAPSLLPCPTYTPCLPLSPCLSLPPSLFFSSLHVPLARQLSLGEATEIRRGSSGLSPAVTHL